MTKKAYSEWIQYTVQANIILSDKSLPKWKKAYKVGGSYRGLQLNELQSKHRRKVINTLFAMNQVLARYDLKEWDDYQHISDVDIPLLIDLSKELASPRMK